jgi:hypothetical protein
MQPHPASEKISLLIGGNLLLFLNNQLPVCDPNNIFE